MVVGASYLSVVLKDRASASERTESLSRLSAPVTKDLSLKRAVPENPHWAEVGQKVFLQ